MNKRLFFDYNSTTPLSSSVENWIRKGDIFFANPSSVHQSGKKSKKYINETKEFIYSLFDISEKNYEVFFHSGATEGINTIVKGVAVDSFKKGETFSYLFSGIDHSCPFNLGDEIKIYGHKSFKFAVDINGDFSLDSIENILCDIVSDDKVLLNFTASNNELGVIWDVDELSSLKEKYPNLYIHIDAAQLPGKVENWNKLSRIVDAITFSGHKFGALKGIGFTIFKKTFNFHHLLTGGGQQAGIRSGTENPFSVYTLKLALEDLVENQDIKSTLEAKEFIEKSLLETFDQNIDIACMKSKKRSSNTIGLIIKGRSSTNIQTFFDMAKIDVSSGSACSSGIAGDNRALKELGYLNEDLRSFIRISFSPLMSMDDAVIYSEKIISILKKIIK